MHPKVILRTARNFILKDKPYFAHLTLTHRCNLKCRYCQITKGNPLEELSLEKTKEIIDILDNMGVAILSITGGEPLLRDDIYDMIDYSKSKNIYVRLVSNGTLPIERYERLLKSKIDSISISLDGIEGDDLPNSKINPKILETINFLYAHRKEKETSIFTLLHKDNEKNIKEILDYVKEKYPDLGIFVQPVVVGKGRLRVNTQRKVNPSFLKELDVLNPHYFIEGCVDYYHKEKFEWNCKAGKMFFDIQPNGDFWICQDIDTNLNILDKDFLEKWKNLDFKSLKKDCEGCTYSCYYLTQKLFEPKNLISSAKTYLKYKRKF